jgi:drug/metabolite transporter (DMT)-like permease
MNFITKNKDNIPVATIFLCCLVWGTTFVVVKDSSTLIDPFLLSAFRNLIAVIVLFMYILISKKTAALKDKKIFIYGSILGFLLAAIYIIQTVGLIYTSSNHSAFISCSAVIMVPVFLYFMGWQKFITKQVLAIIVVTGGLVALTYQPGLSNLNLGDILTFIASIICAFHLIFAGHYVRKVDFLSLIFYQFLIAAIVSFIGLFVNSILITNQPILFRPEAINNVLYLGFIGTLFCYFVTVWGQKKVSTIYTALIFSLEPIFASITSYFVLGETFNTREFIGATFIFVGIIYYSLPKGFISKVLTPKKP